MLGLSRGQARRIVHDELGEPMVVAAKGLIVPVDVLQRMLLFVNPWAGESVDRIYELSELYGDISVDAAGRLIAIWRDAGTAETGQAQHEPVGWRTAAENARRALSEGARRQEPEQDRRARGGERRHLGDDPIEEVTPGAVLDLDDPCVGIEAKLAHQAFFDPSLGAGCSARQRVKRRSEGRASSNTLCGAGPNSSAVPSRRLSLTKMAPASSAPRRRTAANAPSIWQRRI